MGPGGWGRRIRYPDLMLPFNHHLEPGGGDLGAERGECVDDWEWECDC